MRIDRLQRLKDYRIFRDFSWPGSLPNFGRYNLIYGWNATGKTSLSSLFRCMQKRTQSDGVDVQIVVDGVTVKGNEFEAAIFPPLRVFNRDFVDRNVFEKPGEELPPVYYLGEGSAEKQKKISELKPQENSIRESISNLENVKKSANTELNTYCTTQARSIRNLLLGDPYYNNYEAPKYKEQVNLLDILDTLPPPLSLAERKKCESTIGTKSMDHVPVPVFGDLKLTSLTQRIRSVLVQTVVASSISTLVENPTLSAWVQQGMRLHEGDDTCHFCEQPLPSSRIADLEAHFNDQFKQLQTTINMLVDEVDALEKSISSRQLPSRAVLYEHLQADYDKKVSTFLQQSTLLMRYITGLKRALVAKRDEPFKSLYIQSFIIDGGRISSEDSGTLIKVIELVLTGVSTWGAQLGANALEEIVEIIKAHNMHTANFNIEVKAARAALEQDEVVKTFGDWKIHQEALTKATSDLSQALDHLKTVSDEIVELERQTRQHFKSAEELNVEMAAYLGREELKFEVKDSGYTITRGGQPAMHLSEGERTSIAFMYFLKSLRDTGFDLKNGVVVIDDPVSSLDANSLYCAFAYMKAYTREATQLFVLTHNFAFFRQVKNWFNAEGGFLNKPYDPSKAEDVHFYMLNCEVTDAGRSAKLETLDPLLHAYESEYHYLFRCVKDGAARQVPKSLAEVYGMPNIARRLLESFLAFRVPGKAGALRQQVELLNGDAAKKARIVRFLHTYSHADHVAEPEHDLSMLSETPTVLRDVLELMQLNDPPHYDAMLKIV